MSSEVQDQKHLALALGNGFCCYLTSCQRRWAKCWPGFTGGLCLVKTVLKNAESYSDHEMKIPAQNFSHKQKYRIMMSMLNMAFSQRFPRLHLQIIRL